MSRNPESESEASKLLTSNYLSSEPEDSPDSVVPAEIAKDALESKLAPGSSKSPFQVIKNVVSTTDPNPGSSQKFSDMPLGDSANEPLVHVTLEEQAKTGMFETNGSKASTEPFEVDYTEPCIGWDQLADRNGKTNNSIVQGQVVHWRNVTVIYSAVILTWLGVVLGGGFSWCLLVIGCCSTYYMNTVERYRRAARDDAIRELWAQKVPLLIYFDGNMF